MDLDIQVFDMKKLITASLLLLTSNISMACYYPIDYYCLNGILYYNTYEGIAPVVTKYGTWYKCS